MALYLCSIVMLLHISEYREEVDHPKEILKKSVQSSKPMGHSREKGGLGIYSYGKGFLNKLKKKSVLFLFHCTSRLRQSMRIKFRRSELLLGVRYF